MDTFSTADLWDAHHAEIQICDAQFRSFGLRRSFSGRCATIRTPGDHRPVRTLAITPGECRVMVVDGGNALHVALMGDRIASAAMQYGWIGVIAFGAIRDSAAIDQMDFGIKALGTIPRRAETEIGGEAGAVLSVAGVVIRPDAWIYADTDGVLVSPRRLVP